MDKVDQHHTAFKKHNRVSSPGCLAARPVSLTTQRHGAPVSRDRGGLWEVMEVFCEELACDRFTGHHLMEREREQKLLGEARAVGPLSPGELGRGTGQVPEGALCHGKEMCLHPGKSGGHGVGVDSPGEGMEAQGRAVPGR